MLKNNKFLYITTSVILLLNALMWLMIAVIYASWSHYALSNKILLFFQPAIYLLTLIGVWKRNKIAYVSLIFFLFINIIFSWQITLALTKVIFVVNILSMVALLFLHKDFVNKDGKYNRKVL